MSGRPSGHQSHRFATARTARPWLGRVEDRSCWTGWLNRWRQLPGLLLLRGEQGRFFKQSAHAIGPHFGGWMRPAKGAHARKARRQDVLPKPAHELQRLQLHRSEFSGFALAVSPEDLAFGQKLDGAIGGGGLENVTGKVTQGFPSGTGGWRSSH